MKRVFDVLLACLAMLLLLPILVCVSAAIWWQDRASPFYMPWRVGLHGKPFRMIKFRSMVVNADANKVDTTASDDARITKLGAWIRRYKIDEIPQMWNIIKGEMSFVGPRPQIDREVALYTDTERGLLQARPGITDFASIVFSDLGDIMAGHADPNLAYNQLVRPWKSRLALFYIAHSSVWLDIKLIIFTALAIVSRRHALQFLANELMRLGAPDTLVKIARRTEPLVPTPPPGAMSIVTSRPDAA